MGTAQSRAAGDKSAEDLPATGGAYVSGGERKVGGDGSASALPLGGAERPGLDSSVTMVPSVVGSEAPAKKKHPKKKKKRRGSGKKEQKELRPEELDHESLVAFMASVAAVSKFSVQGTKNLGQDIACLELVAVTNNAHANSNGTRTNNCLTA